MDLLAQTTRSRFLGKLKLYFRLGRNKTNNQLQGTSNFCLQNTKEIIITYLLSKAINSTESQNELKTKLLDSLYEF